MSTIGNIPTLGMWDDLFKKAKKQGFNAREDIKEFAAWDVTNSDGQEIVIF